MANFRIKDGLVVGNVVIDAATSTITGTSNVSLGNIEVVNSTISNTTTNGDITITPNGTGSVDVDSSKIINVADPTSAQDAATKSYIDTAISALSSTTLTEGDSSVIVSDTGTGTITLTADAGTVASFAAAATTITASGAINLTAGTDVQIPNNVGVLFGAGGEKIESDGTDLTITSTGALQLTVTGTTTVSGALTVSGDLTVNGTTTTVNSTNTTIDDNLLELNSGAGSNANDCGIIIERGSTGDNAIFMWDESADKFTLGTTTATASTTGNITITTGTLVANLTGTATSANYSDVAERFASDTAYEPGTVVALGGSAEITAVSEEASDEVFGVISGEHQAAFMMNGAAGSDATHPYIAMTGRVDVKVIGAVSKGDRLIASSTPGVARAATKAECTAFNVIGRALSSKDTSGVGTVLAAVRVSH